MVIGPAWKAVRALKGAYSSILSPSAKTMESKLGRSLVLFAKQ